MDMTMIGAWNVKGVQKGCFSHEGPKANLVRVTRVEAQNNSSSCPPWSPGAANTKNEALVTYGVQIQRSTYACNAKEIIFTIELVPHNY